jgi:hypothetical protein
MEEKMVEVRVLVKEPGEDTWKAADCEKFVQMPRIGEFIEIIVGGTKAYFYKVVAVCHPGKPWPNNYAGDIYAVRVGEGIDVWDELFRNS